MKIVKIGICDSGYFICNYKNMHNSIKQDKGLRKPY